MKINKLIEEAPQRHAERVARWKADPQVNDMMRSTAPDRIWFTKIGKDILPNSERVTAEDVEYVRADLACAQLAEALAVPGWQPINTAPRDGAWFIARTQFGTARVVHFADIADRYPIAHDDVIWSSAPTEWIPLDAALRAIGEPRNG